MRVVFEVPERMLRRHLSELPYDMPEFDACSASAVSVGEGTVTEAFVLPPPVTSADAADYELLFFRRRREEDEISVMARAIPSKNLKAIELLEQWFSRPSGVPKEKWREFDQIIAEGRSFSFQD